MKKRINAALSILISTFVAMMLHSLQLRNYKQYRELNLEFREGLVGIIGKNGAGKSTLFEAILFCLFGREEGNKSFVRSASADPRANVSLSLEFDVGELRYRVYREFRGKALTSGAALYKNEVLIAKGVAPVNEELVKILNIEREGFKRSVFSGQKELAELSETTGETRKKMVRRMLGLDTLDAVQQLVNADIRDLNSQISGQRQNLLDEEVLTGLRHTQEEHNQQLLSASEALIVARALLAETEARRAVEKKRFDEEESRQKRFNDLQNQVAQLEERQKNLAQNFQALEQKRREIAALAEKVEKEKPRFAQYEKDKKRLEELEILRQKRINRKGYLSRIEALQAPLQDIGSEIAAIDKRLEQQPGLEKKAAVLKTDLALLKNKRDEKRSQYTLLGNQLSALLERASQRQQQIARLQEIGAEGTCPTCFQPVKNAYDSVVGQLQQELENLTQQEKIALEQQLKQVEKEGIEIKRQQEALELESRQTEDQLTMLVALKNQRAAELRKKESLLAQVVQNEAILKEIGEVDFDEKQFESLKMAIQSAGAEHQKHKSEEEYVRREVGNNLVQLTRTEKEQASTTSDLNLRRTERSQLSFNPEQYQAAKTAFTGYDAILSEQSTALRVQEAKVSEIKNAVQRIQLQLENNDRIQAQISDKLGEIELLDKLSKHLGLFKTDILDRVSPGISREASQLFSRITKGKYERIEVDENFEFSISDGGLLYPIQRFSGGEVDLANFCLRIAITKAIMEIGGGQKIEFLAFDEIFGSQDEERRLEIMHALHYLQEQFRQIYIVSHNETLKDFFPHLLEVALSPEGSVVLWR